MAALFVTEVSIVSGLIYARFGKLPTMVQDIIIKALPKGTLKFKVVGENKFFALVETEACAEHLLQELNTSLGHYVIVKTTPVRDYADFARNVLQVDPKVCAPRKDPIATTKKIFFARIVIDHPGSSLDDLFAIWKIEATGGLTARTKGEIEFRAFKVIAQKAILIFYAADQASDWDDSIYNLPLAKSAISASEFRFNDFAQVMPF